MVRIAARPEADAKWKLTTVRVPRDTFEWLQAKAAEDDPMTPNVSRIVRQCIERAREAETADNSDD